MSLEAVAAPSVPTGVNVLIGSGKATPTPAQLQQVLDPGDMVRDVLGWHLVDRYCDLATNKTRTIRIPAATMLLYQNVQAAQGRNFVTLAFNNTHCGQISNSGAQTFPNTPALRAEFAAYAVQTVLHVPAIGGISIWNELDGTWNGGNMPVSQRLAEYCLLANSVITEVRKVNKTIPIAIGASLGWNIDGWFIEMFDQSGCLGKADPNIWLDVHPYLNGRKVRGTSKTDFQMWRAAIANIRADGITNPLVATEWGGPAAYAWQTAHPSGNYMTTFQSEVLSRDPNWASAFWFEMLYSSQTPNAGLFNASGQLTSFGTRYIAAF